MTAPIELFFWLTPNAWKISIALEEMEIPYVVRPVAIGKGEQFKTPFLRVSPNNKLPAIVDPQGPDGSPIAIFESGAILQYLGRKSGMYYPDSERERVEVDKWLFWQMAGVGPMFGQASHFRIYAPNLVDDSSAIDYSVRRYDNEVNRLLGVMDQQLKTVEYIAGPYSIADMALYPWVSMSEKLGQDISPFRYVLNWLVRVAERPAVQSGMAAGEQIAQAQPEPGSKERAEFDKNLFGQTAVSITKSAAMADTTAP